VRYKNIAGRFFGLVTKHACDRRTDGDRRTDRQNYDSQDRASVTRAVKTLATANVLEFKRVRPICRKLPILTYHLDLFTPPAFTVSIRSGLLPQGMVWACFRDPIGLRLAVSVEHWLVTDGQTHDDNICRFSTASRDENAFYRSTQLCHRGLGSRNSVRPSVRLSVRPSHAESAPTGVPKRGGVGVTFLSLLSLIY